MMLEEEHRGKKSKLCYDATAVPGFPPKTAYPNGEVPIKKIK